MGRMRLHRLFCVALLCLISASQAALTIHIQFPWRNDAAKASYQLHILGGTTSYNPDFGTTSVT